MHRHFDEECDGVLGDYSVEDKLEDLSRGIRVARVDSVKADYLAVMTNHETLLRQDCQLHLDHELLGMYGPPRRRKRNVRVSQVGLRKCIRPLLE